MSATSVNLAIALTISIALNITFLFFKENNPTLPSDLAIAESLCAQNEGVKKLTDVSYYIPGHMTVTCNNTAVFEEVSRYIEGEVK